MVSKDRVTKKDIEIRLHNKIQELEIEQAYSKTLKTENSTLTAEVKELKEALRHEIHKDFVTAAELENPPTVWIAAINCGNLSKVLNNIWVKLTADQERGKIFFDIADDGSIKNPRPG